MSKKKDQVLKFQTSLDFHKENPDFKPFTLRYVFVSKLFKSFDIQILEEKLSTQIHKNLEKQHQGSSF